MRGETDSIGNFQDAGKGTRCREHGNPVWIPSTCGNTKTQWHIYVTLALGIGKLNFALCEPPHILVLKA